MNDIPPIVIVLKTATLLIGGFITYIAASAARKTGWEGLSYLAVGFGTVTLGSLLAGIADQLLLISTHNALIVENTMATVGFAIIGYSLYATRRSSGGI
ncbi:hypothetical protein ACFQJ5_18325 [Halomicroarcula sp. GCM10025324]|uniref:DUF7521 family protein n=1 Tax=Haloarcula TaxID=2237 RepID=UPI0023E7AAC1|nr:hypothetical protein [Halomicroarcula sp. ZS-22-S1]